MQTQTETRNRQQLLEWLGADDAETVESPDFVYYAIDYSSWSFAELQVRSNSLERMREIGEREGWARESLRLMAKDLDRVHSEMLRR